MDATVYPQRETRGSGEGENNISKTVMSVCYNIGGEAVMAVVVVMVM